MKVKLWSDSSQAIGMLRAEVVEVADDTTDKQLSDEAEAFMQDNLQPEFGFEKLDESHNGHDCEDEDCADSDS